MSIKVYHADHGVSKETIKWALKTIRPNGFFLRTLKLPIEHRSLMNALYGPAAGDAPVPESAVFYKKRSADRPASRMIAKPKRKTRLLTLIGMADGDDIEVFTAYGGPAAEREPGDPSMSSAEQAKAVSFWKKHALASK